MLNIGDCQTICGKYPQRMYFEHFEFLGCCCCLLLNFFPVWWLDRLCMSPARGVKSTMELLSSLEDVGRDQGEQLGSLCSAIKPEELLARQVLAFHKRVTGAVCTNFLKWPKWTDLQTHLLVSLKSWSQVSLEIFRSDLMCWEVKPVWGQGQVTYVYLSRGNGWLSTGHYLLYQDLPSPGKDVLNGLSDQEVIRYRLNCTGVLFATNLVSGPGESYWKEWCADHLSLDVSPPLLHPLKCPLIAMGLILMVGYVGPCIFLVPLGKDGAKFVPDDVIIFSYQHC